MADNRAIGKDNKLLWHLSEDLKRFKKLTMGHPVIMGRKTHESIGRVLPGRKNIVLTRRRDFQSPGVYLCHDMDDALEQCEGAEQAFVIGGADIYRLFLPCTDRIYVTQLHESYPDADTFFPELEAEEFIETQRQTPTPQYRYITYERAQ